MALAVKIVDASPVGRPQHSFTLHLASERLSARELLRRRIQQEVEQFNNQQHTLYQGLVQPTETEMTLNGYRLPTVRPLDAAQQVVKAEQAFEHNGFIMLLDDRQIADLDEQVTLTRASVITFIKLVPLVGG